jgi:DNA-binding transcriptional MocR family regulator
MLDLAQYQIGGSTAREIASSVEASIREGLVRTGDQLPTVRALAERLGTSPATVNAAYRILRQRGLVVGEGRRGTRVAPRPPVRPPADVAAREPSVQRTAGVRDLTIGLPDPELLLPVQPVLERIDLDAKMRISSLESIDPELLALATESFRSDGLPVDSIAVMAGAFDGVERVLQAHLRPGDRVVVEDPAYTSTRDILLALGLVAVPVPVDEFGALPEPFEARLEQGVEAVVLVPRAQNPFGSAMDAERSSELQAVIAKHPDVVIVEDDHAGIVSGASFSTIVTPAARRWAVIRSTSKVLHPDLRVALMAGDAATIARVEGRQALGTRWVSHVLQAIVVELLRDPGFTDNAARARDAYTSRREAMIGALAARGVPAHGRSGLNVWVPVRQEAPVVGALLDAGWLVAAGEQFRIHTPPGIRITISALRDGEAELLADEVAAVEHAGRPRRAY